MKKFYIDSTSSKRGCSHCAFYGNRHICKGYSHREMFMCREIRAKLATRFCFKEVT